MKGSEQESREVRHGRVHLQKPFVQLLDGRGVRIEYQGLIEDMEAVRTPSIRFELVD